MQKHCHTCVLLHMTFTSLMWQFLCVLTILYSCFLSVAVLRHPDQRQFRGRKVYLAYRTRSQSIIEGSQGRKSKQKLRDRPVCYSIHNYLQLRYSVHSQRNIAGTRKELCLLIAPRLLVSCLRNGATHSGLGHPAWINNQGNSYKVWSEQSVHWCSPLCAPWVDKVDSWS